MKKFIKVSFQLSSSGEAEILVANLSEIGFYAFDEEGVNATRHEILLNAYINEADFSEKKIHELLGPGSQYSTEVLIEQNWNEEWESGFQPVCINSFAGIRASFHEPLKNVTHEIVITPKMSFGTGHHATTFLMVEQMEAIQFTNKTVIDFGTGTGVLAILAEKCGAAKVLAIDNDIWSIDNAIENTSNNYCKKITVVQHDINSQIENADIILANLDRSTLLKNVDSFSLISEPGTILLISGFFVEDVPIILHSFNAVGFTETVISEKATWCSIRLMRQ